nr:unnamed protein product [Callosobruchus chinensis]
MQSREGQFDSSVTRR